MARTGVTEAQVHAAADALLAQGERPTIERLRSHLGTGSPNTVMRFLDSWWSTLSQRLARRLSLPEAPAAVSEAFAQAWAVAVDAGQRLAETQIAPERAAVADALLRIDAAAAAHTGAVTELTLRLEQAQEVVRSLEVAVAAKDQRLSDLQREIGAGQARLEDLARQREALEARLRTELAHVEGERGAAAKERESLQGLLRQVEDRAYTEVDRHRQDLKALRAQVATQTRDYAARGRESDQVRRKLEAALQKSLRDATSWQTRYEALVVRSETLRKSRSTKSPIGAKRTAAKT